MRPLLRAAALIGATALLGYAPPASSQPARPSPARLDSLDGWVRSFMQERRIPGVTYALVSNGRVLASRQLGLADVELRVPVTDSTVFEIGSISKQFVAAAVMLLVEQGRLGLDDPIHRHLADLPSDWMGVTIRQLLTHTSGIPDYEEIATYDVYRFRLTPEEVIRIAHSRPVDFAPGTGFYYSNTGYFLLSRIVERVEGEPLGRVLQRRIFGPLRMTRTRMADPEAIIPNRASGYWVNRTGELINRMPTETSSTLGAGGILSSVGDMALWDAALRDDRLLSAASRRTMWTPVQLPGGQRTRWPGGTPVDYAFGWEVTPMDGVPSQHHTGQVAGFTAYWARFPQQDVAVVIFLNRYQAGAGPMMQRIMHTLVPALGPVP
jgi:D-alanyl-D-alanine carboxypeptidase